MAATPPGKGRSAARRPGARRGERRGARGADSVLGPRPGGPGWMRRLPAPAAGQSVTPMSLGAAAETAGTGPQAEPQPERRAAEAEEGRGHSVDDPLTRKQLWSRWRALRDGLVPQRPATHRLWERGLGPRVRWRPGRPPEVAPPGPRGPPNPSAPRTGSGNVN